MKLLVIALLACVLLVGMVGAISLEMKNTYLQGETMNIEIKGNILEPIKEEQVLFKRGHVEVPFEYGTENLNGKNWVWAIAPLKEENYTIIIKNIATTNEGVVGEIDYEKNFSVGSNKTDYNVRPGVVFTKDSFVLNAFLYEDEEKTISLNFPINREILLVPGENQINFDIDYANNSGMFIAKIGHYNIPIYLTKGVGGKKESMISIRLLPGKIERSIFLGNKKEIKYSVALINEGSTEATNIKFRHGKNIFIEFLNKSVIGAGKQDEFNVTIKNISGDEFYDVVSVVEGDIEEDLIINLTFTNNESLADEKIENTSKKVFKCKEMLGSVCGADEKCSGEVISSLDGSCCLGSCKKEESGKANWTIVGWSLGILVLLILIAIVIKYKKAKSSSGLNKRVSEIERIS